MTEILVFSEQDTVAFELLAFARAAGTAAVAVLGRQATARAGDYGRYGAEKVYINDDERLDEFHVDVYAEALAQIAKTTDVTTILVGSTRRGKELTGRLAQKLGAGAVTDVIALKQTPGGVEAQRYALGGNTIATDIVQAPRQVLAIMPRTFEAVEKPASGTVVPIELKVPEPRVKLVERKPKPKATADIEKADRLVVVGKGFAKKEDLSIAMALAKSLGAELGCTRALSADYHWLSEDRMVGVSGKKGKPTLVISIGVSGEIQHTVGILGSKYIVAINKDKGAPIFRISDYGIVGDLYQVTPKLTASLG